MPRKLRLEYEGVYHVMNRGDRREPIFKDDQDRELFLKTIGGVLCQNGLAGACVLSDVQSLSSGEWKHPNVCGHSDGHF